MWIPTFPSGRHARYRSSMLFLAEFYLPAGSSLASVAERARAGAVQAASAGTDIAFVEAIFLPQDESCFMLYQACCAADIAAAGSLAELAFDRMTDAMVSRGASS